MNTIPLRACIVVSVLAISACGDDLPAGAVLHPVEEFMPYASSAINDNASEVNDSLTAVVKNILRYERQLEIGVGDHDDPAEYVGTIDDVELSESGLTYLLDAANSNVKLYNDRGELLSVVGTSGEGPGEFRAPKGIDIDSDGRILLTDGGKRSQILVPFPDVNDQYEASVIEQFVVDAVFADDGFVVALAEFQTDSLLIRMMPLEENGAVQYSGRKYNSSNRVVNWNMSEGIAVPVVDSGFVVIFNKMPLVVKFSSALEVEWATLIPDYSPLKTYGYVNSVGNDVSRIDRKGITDRLQDAVIIADSMLLVQIARVEADFSLSRIPTNYEIRNYVVSESGRVSRIESNLIVDGDGIPMSIAAWGEEQYVVASTYPVPKAFLRKR